MASDLLKLLCKIMDHDLRINIGPKFVLDAIHPKAFTAFNNSNNLEKVIEKFSKENAEGNDEEEKEEDEDSDAETKPKLQKNLSTGISTGSPVRPMLAKYVFSFARGVEFSKFNSVAQALQDFR